MSDPIGDLAEAEDRIAKLAKERDGLALQLHEVKHKRADYIAAVHEATTEAIGRIKLSPVPKPLKAAKRKGRPEVAVALLSDLQTGKVTPDYNSDVARERVMRYARKIVRITNIQRMDHPVNHCVVPLLGDLVEGCDIFPGQQYLLDSTLYRQVFESTPSIIVDFLQYLLANFDTVTVEAVQGNHGRIGRKGVFGPEDNADRMVHRLISMLMREEPRITFNLADPAGERAWYKVMHIGNYSAMLIHGDQIKASMGYPFYGYGKKIHAWASGGISEPFKDLMAGHFHQIASIPFNHRTLWQNGSTESTNTYAQEFLAAQSPAAQWLLFCDPKEGQITGSYAVRLLED